MPSDNHIEHVQMVMELVKDPNLIMAELTPQKAALLHAAIGIAGEAGELLDAVKKHVIYNKPLDLENVIEELGDLEFYQADMRYIVGTTRDDVLRANITKLRTRYPNGQYTNQLAAARLDKAVPTEVSVDEYKTHLDSMVPTQTQTPNIPPTQVVEDNARKARTMNLYPFPHKHQTHCSMCNAPKVDSHKPNTIKYHCGTTGVWDGYDGAYKVTQSSPCCDNAAIQQPLSPMDSNAH